MFVHRPGGLLKIEKGSHLFVNFAEDPAPAEFDADEFGPPRGVIAAEVDRGFDGLGARGLSHGGCPAPAGAGRRARALGPG